MFKIQNSPSRPSLQSPKIASKILPIFPSKTAQFLLLNSPPKTARRPQKKSQFSILNLINVYVPARADKLVCMPSQINVIFVKK